MKPRSVITKPKANQNKTLALRTSRNKAPTRSIRVGAAVPTAERKGLFCFVKGRSPKHLKRRKKAVLHYLI